MDEQELSEEELEQLLLELFNGGESEELFEQLSQGESRSFEESGVLTTNRGLTLRLSNGQEFQLTLVRSR